MNVRHSLYAVTLLFVGCGTKAPEPLVATPDPLTREWHLAEELIGDWVDSTSSDTFLVHESWKATNDSTLDGRGQVMAGNDTVFIELLKLERRAGVLIYSALPGGQVKGIWTSFQGTTSSGDTLFFENPAHDFPQRIRYQMEGPGWHASASGTDHGKLRESHFWYVRR